MEDMHICEATSNQHKQHQVCRHTYKRQEEVCHAAHAPDPPRTRASHPGAVNKATAFPSPRTLYRSAMREVR